MSKVEFIISRTLTNNDKNLAHLIQDVPCFGYLDEVEDECQSCGIQGACAEERMKMFITIADNLEKTHLKSQTLDDLADLVSTVKGKREQVKQQDDLYNW